MATDVYYDLALVNAELSQDESAALAQVEQIGRAIHELGGAEVGIWEYRFETFEAAQAGASEIRRAGVVFESLTIKAVDASGKELKS
jgi:hypothetical protein